MRQKTSGWFPLLRPPSYNACHASRLPLTQCTPPSPAFIPFASTIYFTTTRILILVILGSGAFISSFVAFVTIRNYERDFFNTQYNALSDVSEPWSKPAHFTRWPIAQLCA